MEGEVGPIAFMQWNRYNSGLLLSRKTVAIRKNTVAKILYIKLPRVAKTEQ